MKSVEKSLSEEICNFVHLLESASQQYKAVGFHIILWKEISLDLDKFVKIW